MKYIKKPIVIEAFQYGIDEHPEWFYLGALKGVRIYEDMCLIPTLEDEMKAYVGDMIIKGIQGEIYPCKKDIFDASYEKVEEND
jgi:hypothetical protein